MNILSLFDGISCGMLALNEAGIKVDSYYASEVNEKAIKVSNAHFPDIVRIGDVCKVNYSDGTLFWDGGEAKVKIDVIIGGSPCQNLSNIGNKHGIRGDKSILALEYFRLLQQVKPRFFLLENVAMGKNDKEIFSTSLGLEPIFINSSVFGAQIRKRNYWTNIPVPPIPKKVSLHTVENILDERVTDRSKTYSFDQESFVEFLGRLGISSLKTEHGKEVDVTCLKDKTRANRYRLEHIRAMNQKCRCLSTQCGNLASTSGGGVFLDGKLRGFTPTEVERLQGIPVGYTKMLAKTYRYQVIGDGWHVPTIAHIFSGLKTSSIPKTPVIGNMRQMLMLNDKLKEFGLDCYFHEAVSIMMGLRNVKSDSRKDILSIIKKQLD